jgi:hypothetical protein
MIHAKQVRRWRRDTFRILQSIDRRWRATDPTFSGAMVLAAIAAIGTDPSALQDLTGFSKPFIVKILRRARKHKIIVGSKMRTAWADEGFAGQMAVICDALVVAHDVARVPDAKLSAIQKKAAQKRAAAVKRPRRKRAPMVPGTMFTPKQVKSNPLYIMEANIKASATTA